MNNDVVQSKKKKNPFIGLIHTCDKYKYQIFTGRPVAYDKQFILLRLISSEEKLYIF